MARYSLLITYISIIIFSNTFTNAQQLEVIFGANIGKPAADSTGFIDYDLYSATFNPNSGEVSHLVQLTDYDNTAEFFPSLSPNLKWVAYNFSKGKINQVRLIDLTSGNEFIISEKGRFPEWKSDNELYYTYLSADTQDVHLLNLDFTDSTPKILNDFEITNRINCPGTGIASDPYPIGNSNALLFHVLRPNQSGAALATINNDGTGYRRLTDWNGSGHGIISGDGKTVISSNSQTGKCVRLEIESDTVYFNYLPLSPFKNDIVQFDSRFSTIPVSSYAYQSWGTDERSVFHSLKGSDESLNLYPSRLIYTKFDDNWGNPVFVNFSKNIEQLIGENQKDFTTCSARVINNSTDTLTEGKVYVTIFMHNEDPHHPDYPDYSLPSNKQMYIDSRNALLNFCKMLDSNNVKLDWQTDWNFLNGVLLWETADVTANTNGKNIVRYLKEDLNFSVDPHSHENDGYNYSDVAYLIDSVGVTPSDILGGFVWDPSVDKYQDWERFRVDVPGNKFNFYSWRPSIMIGAASPAHENDISPSGVWRPKGKYSFFEDDPDGNLIVIGQYDGTITGIKKLYGLYSSGQMQPDEILTSNLTVNQWELNDEFTANFKTQYIKPLLDLQQKGMVKLATFDEVLSDWQAIYNSKPNLYNVTATDINDASNIPGDYYLSNNYPNPFNPETVINYRLPSAGHISIKVYDILGNLIETLVDGYKQPGNYSIKFDASQSEHSRRIASGVYIYRIQSNMFSESKKMIYLK